MAFKSISGNRAGENPSVSKTPENHGQFKADYCSSWLDRPYSFPPRARQLYRVIFTKLYSPFDQRLICTYSHEDLLCLKKNCLQINKVFSFCINMLCLMKDKPKGSLLPTLHVQLNVWRRPVCRCRGKVNIVHYPKFVHIQYNFRTGLRSDVKKIHIPKRTIKAKTA